jgi:hypothetical protein
MSFDTNDLKFQNHVVELWYGNSKQNASLAEYCINLRSFAADLFHSRLIRLERIIIRKYTSWLSAIILVVTKINGWADLFIQTNCFTENYQYLKMVC